LTETWRLFEIANARRNRIRTILLDISGFHQVAQQMELFEKDTKVDRLSSALDIVRKKFDFLSIHSANVS